MSEPQKICPQCKLQQPLSAAFCPGCGRQFRTTAPQRAFPDDRTILAAPPPEAPPAPAPYPHYVVTPNDIGVPVGRHSVVGAVLASLCFLGVGGQFYNQQVVKGLVLLAVEVAVAAFTCGWGLLVVYPLLVVDAGFVAARLNRGEYVGQWQCF